MIKKNNSISHWFWLSINWLWIIIITQEQGKGMRLRNDILKGPHSTFIRILGSFCYIKAVRPAGELPDPPSVAHWDGLQLIQLWQDFVPSMWPGKDLLPPAESSFFHSLQSAAQIATVPCVHRSLGNCEFGETAEVTWYLYHCTYLKD